MGGSSGGGYDTVTPSWGDYSYYDPNDPNKQQLFLGATSSEPSSAPATVGNDPGDAMLPGATTFSNSGTSGGKSFGDWLMSKEGAAALQKTGESLKDPQSNQAPKGSQLVSAQMPGTSGVVRGSTQTLSQIMQLLNSRRYSPIGYSGGSSTRGLMGY